MCPHSSLLVLGMLATVFKEEKDIKRSLFEKKRCNCLFAHDITLYTENPRVDTRKLLELINEYSQ